jgi:hypothetical protein
MRTQKEIAEWVVNTCLLFGSSVPTAHIVAATFVEGIQNSRSMTDEEAEGVQGMIRSKVIPTEEVKF